MKNLGSKQKKIFVKPRENMKCDLPNSVVTKCVNFVEVFNNMKNEIIKYAYENVEFNHHMHMF